MNWENSKTGGGGLQWRNENEKYSPLVFLEITVQF
jgi:hypothetical protein